MKTVTIYTDGACSGNPGPGGWACILSCNGVEKEASGGEPNTTNNRMELTAVVEALSLLKQSCVVELYSDSRYVIDGLEKCWAQNWRANDWVRAGNKKVLNVDLWELLLVLTDQHEMHYHWVQGHADDEMNKRCDKLAVSARKKFQ